MSARIERAGLLIDQSRFELAEKELRMELVENPEEPLPHALLSQCLSGQKRYSDAIAAAQQAIRHGPDLPFTHYAHALAHYQRNDYQKATMAVEEAIRLDPYDSDYFALQAAIQLDRQEWLSGLKAAEKGLELDPQHTWSQNLRSYALLKLGRSDEAKAGTEEALAQNPEDAFSHASRGWALLHDKDAQKALEHFREALRLDPDLEFARSGMIEAMKARYWFYRQMLGYFLWLSTLSPQVRWGFIIGLVILQQILTQIGNQNPALQPFITPILITYLAFVVSTWITVPLSNLFLRFNRFGKYALSRAQRVQSNIVGFLVVVALLWGIYAIAGSGVFSELAPVHALAALILVLPISYMFLCDAGWPRKIMIIYVFIMILMVIFLLLLTRLLQIEVQEGLQHRIEGVVELIRDVFQFYCFSGVFSMILGSGLSRIRFTKKDLQPDIR